MVINHHGASRHQYQFCRYQAAAINEDISTRLNSQGCTMKESEGSLKPSFLIPISYFPVRIMSIMSITSLMLTTPSPSMSPRTGCPVPEADVVHSLPSIWIV